jgi:hypothetical protein
MENKSLESLNSELFLLPEESLLHIQGGTLAVAEETRYKTWTPHGGHEDMDGYKSDSHVA